jgi:signal transduction histidine kinase
MDLQHFPGIALELSAEGRVLASNGHLEAQIGSELIGRELSTVLDESSQQKWRQLLANRQQSTQARPWELVLKTPQTLELRTFLTVWSGPDANSTLWLLEHKPDPRLERLYKELSDLHSELTNAQRELSRERNRLARALKEAEAAIQTRDNVLAIISHELRNPLNTIGMTTSFLELPLPEEEKTIQLQVIQRAIGRMSRLLNDLLDVSAIESGRLRLEKSPLRLPPLLREVCASFQNEAAQKALDLSCTLLADFPLIQGDRGRLMQALANLVSNAIKFTPPNGRICVSAHRGEGEVIISVEDTGAGIPAADLPHIFERFWHAHRSKQGGTGLGLAITKGIIEAHGGRIWVESKASAGTTMEFSLPFSAKELSP